MSEAIVPKTEELNLDKVKSLAKSLNDFYTSVMQRDVDYSIIPGTSKPSLRKEGAELLSKGFGYRAESQLIDKEMQTDPPYFSFVVKCTLYDKNGEKVGEALGAANSKELQFAYKWIPEEKLQVEQKIYGERQKDGKREFRVELEPWEVFGKQNQVLKMADKRAFVAAVLRVTGASRIFTQDLEETQEPEPKAEKQEVITLDDVMYALRDFEGYLGFQDTQREIRILQQQPMHIGQLESINKIVQDLGGASLPTTGMRIWRIPKSSFK